MKKKILIGARTSWHLTDWVESGFLEKLEKKYDLYFFFVNHEFSTESIPIPDEYSSEIIKKKFIFPYKKSFFHKKSSNTIIRKFKTFCRLFRPKLNQLTYFLNETSELRKIHKKNKLINALKYDAPILRYIVGISLNLKLEKFLSNLINFYLKFTTPKMVPRDEKFDLILLSYNSFNAGGYLDDLMRDAKKLNLKTFGIQLNHDNLIERVPLIHPDYLGVWGMQTFTWCVGSHKIPPYKLNIVGSPRYDLLINLEKQNKEESKEILNLPKDSKVLLFCPSVRSHDEEYILNEIQKNIDNKNLPENLFILYKNHELKIDDYGKKLSSKKLNGKFQNIKIWSDIKENNKKYFRNNLKNFTYLYSAAEAIISPFSTMCLESLMLGKPVMIYNYDTEDYGKKSEYLMKLVKHRIYQYPLLNSDAVEICDSREKITRSINNLFEKIKNENTFFLSKQTSRQSILFNKTPSSTRIMECINKILQNQEFDNSKEYFK